jgi:hypothetical protein
LQQQPAIFFLAGAFLATFLAGAFLATFFATFLATMISPFWTFDSAEFDLFRSWKFLSHRLLQ